MAEGSINQHLPQGGGHALETNQKDNILEHVPISLYGKITDKTDYIYFCSYVLHLEKICCLDVW